jgi:pimeloyl-ACP methyl ester carboxylesterase
MITIQNIRKRNLNMNTQSPLKKMANLFKRGLIGIMIFILVLASAGTIYQTAASEADKRNFPPPGHLIDVGGFKMHIYCMGEGSPTVVLETLAGGTSSYWGWVQPEVAQTTRVCVYDRAGRGWSEPDADPITLERTVRNLHTLLTNARIDGPYVLVGHSIGGIYVRQFAADYPDEVLGIALVDSAHPEQFERYPELLKGNETYMQISAIFPTVARFGINRLYFASGGEFDFGGLTEPQKSELKALWSSPDYFLSQQAEGIAATGIYANAQKLGHLGDLPLLVISAGQNTPNGWGELQDDLASLSINSVHITLENATHVSLAFNQNDAHEVSMAILQMVNAIHTRQPLKP